MSKRIQEKMELNQQYGFFNKMNKEMTLKHLKKQMLKSQINSLINLLHYSKIDKSYENFPLLRLLYLAWTELDKKIRG